MTKRRQTCSTLTTVRGACDAPENCSEIFWAQAAHTYTVQHCTLECALYSTAHSSELAHCASKQGKLARYPHLPLHPASQATSRSCASTPAPRARPTRSRCACAPRRRCSPRTTRPNTPQGGGLRRDAMPALHARRPCMHVHGAALGTHSDAVPSLCPRPFATPLKGWLPRAPGAQRQGGCALQA